MISFCKKSFSNLVRVKYADIIKNKDIFAEIDQAYSDKGLGLMVIEDVPLFEEKRTKLLRLIQKFSNSPKSYLDKLESPQTNYSYGWSRGKEIYDLKPDELKGSFYALLDSLNLSVKNPQSNNNIWPSDLPEFKAQILEVGNEIRRIGLILLSYIDRFINSHFPSHKLETIRNQIHDSEFIMTRALYYYPKKEFPNSDGQWAGWHNDHGSLTGLCNSLYLDENGNEGKFNLTKTGLFIQNRKGELIKASYRACDIAYQLGETIQIQSGGLLSATPHAVFVEDDIPDNYGRSTFVEFMQPNSDVQLKIPTETNYDKIRTSDIYKNVPKLQDRFNKETTFGEFNDATLRYFYSQDKNKL